MTKSEKQIIKLLRAEVKAEKGMDDYFNHFDASEAYESQIRKEYAETLIDMIVNGWHHDED